MEVSPALGEDVPFSVQSPFRFAARYVAHDGRASARELNHWCDRFAEKPPGEIAILLVTVGRIRLNTGRFSAIQVLVQS